MDYTTTTPLIEYGVIALVILGLWTVSLLVRGTIKRVKYRWFDNNEWSGWLKDE